MKKYMKKIVYTCILYVFSILATACHNNINVETSLISIETAADTNYVDITTKVKNAKSEYQPLYDFGLKHGLLYSNGEQTKGVPVMEEIKPLNVGDKV